VLILDTNEMDALAAEVTMLVCLERLALSNNNSLAEIAVNYCLTTSI
jgi:hypothetical protein